MSEENKTEARPRRRSSDVGIPDWAKLAAVATTVATFVWATSTFISRTEMNQHMEQQTKDFTRIAASQDHYAEAERVTARAINNVEVKLTGIETKVELVLDGVLKQGVKADARFKNRD
jgi:hypothetical protein